MKVKDEEIFSIKFWIFVAVVAGVVVFTAVATYWWICPPYHRARQWEGYRLTEIQRNAEPIQSVSLEEAAALYNEILGPTIARVRKNYSVESLRLRFDAIMNDIGEGKLIALSISTKHNDGWACASLTEDGHPIIFLHANYWYQFVKKKLNSCESPAQAMHRLEDKLITVLAHEHYHHANQDVSDNAPSRKQIVSVEAACWAYTCETFIQPMIDAGRGPKPGDIEHSLNKIYHQYHFNKDSPHWRYLIRECATQFSKKQIIPYM